MSKIELRLTDVEPPASEPKRTIYRDIVNLPSTVKLGLTARYFNRDDVGLYFQITGSATGYTFGTVNLGLLGSGANTYVNLDEFASRTKPSSGDLTEGEMEENITLTLRAYTDSGYTNLKWTYTRTLTIHWINSADVAFTVDVLNNFDDGTLQGWAAVAEVGAVDAINLVSDYVLSAPYSLYARTGTGIYSQQRMRVYKSFTTPNKDKVFAIIDLRLSCTYTDGNRIKNVRIQRDDTLLVFIGRPYDGTNVDYTPRDKWIRIVVPLPKNTTVEMRIIPEYITYNYNGTIWMDDFKIISK